MTPLPKSNFTANLLTLNRTAVPGFKKWLFEPGMGYGEQNKWWGGKNPRNSSHEGLDFAVWLDREDRERHLGCGVVVPPLYRGRPVGMIDDFLGRTVIVAHEIANRQGHILHGFHAHLLPTADLEIGKVAAESTGLGIIAPGNRNCPPHFHISTAWLAPGYPLAQFNWAEFGERDGFQPCDPLDFL